MRHVLSRNNRTKNEISQKFESSYLTAIGFSMTKWYVFRLNEYEIYIYGILIYYNFKFLRGYKC